MSTKSKRQSVGSTYSSSRKRQIRDLSVSSHDEHQDASRSEVQAPGSDTKKKTKNGTNHDNSEKSKAKSRDDDDSGKDPKEDESEEEYEVEKIKSHRYQGKTLQYRVGWKGYPSDDDSWEPQKHLTGALELLQKYKDEHNLDSKPRGRASTASAKPASKKPAKRVERNEGSAEEEGEDDGEQTSRKRKRLSQEKSKSSIAPLRKNGINGPTKADRASVANRKNVQHDSDASGDEIESVDEDEWHARYKHLASWEDLIRSVRTIEKSNLEDDGANSPTSTSNSISVCLLWKTGRTTWISNKTARVKLPQKLLDFYEAHLQFSTNE